MDSSTQVDITYGKTGKKISGCNIHHDHAAKLNNGKRIFGHCRVVFIHMGKDKNRFFPIFTTDLSLSAKEMIECYAARWKIESGFTRTGRSGYLFGDIIECDMVPMFFLVLLNNGMGLYGLYVI